ncbi:MAG: threonylcarbamoyl-AMP synthase [Candidatus Doudnabacteria bacterium]|nr:threonylcarbamoyl-AMP synthase [Candidatus Doudnabacteria bacterium]
MVIIDYNKKHHQKIIHACVAALKQGKVVAYPTDTCYGLAADVSNLAAVKKVFAVKGRSFKKPVSIIPPSAAASKKIVVWDKLSEKLAKKFFPGPITLVLSIKNQELRGKNIKALSANTGELGIRQPKNNIALDLAKYLKQPITTTSANISGEPECYSAEELLKQFEKAKYKPDIIINSGRLAKRKPSTLIKVVNGEAIVLRAGPISERKIKSYILHHKS